MCKTLCAPLSRLSVLMQCCGCASITSPRSAAGTTCTSTTETPCTLLWLPSSGERLLEIAQLAFGPVSEAPTNGTPAVKRWLLVGKQWLHNCHCTIKTYITDERIVIIHVSTLPLLSLQQIIKKVGLFIRKQWNHNDSSSAGSRLISWLGFSCSRDTTEPIPSKKK